MPEFLVQFLLALAWYAGLIVVMRLAGKRLAGQTTAFDLVVLITIGVVLQQVTLREGALNALVFVATTRSDPALASIPVVVMSGLEKAEINTSLLGATGYLRKPPSLDQLLEVVARTRK